MSVSTLVTGGTGFTGSHLTRALVERGHRVKVLARPRSNLEPLEGLDVEIVTGDLTEELPKDALSGVDTVYHVAAAFRGSEVSDDYFFKVNVEGTERLLEMALQSEVSRFVHISTIGVLGHIENPPADENTPPNPHDHYQVSKLEGEKRALEFCLEHSLPVTMVRPGSIYGPGDLRLLKLFRSIDRGVFRMIGKGENHFHMVYIDDLVDGILLAGDSDETIGEVVILCGEEAVQVKDLVRLIAAILRRPAPKGSIPVRPVMLAARLAKKLLPPLGIEPPLYPRRLDFFVSNRSFRIDKARQLLGYQPKYDLRTGLTKTVEWYRQKNYL